MIALVAVLACSGSGAETGTPPAPSPPTAPSSPAPGIEGHWATTVETSTAYTWYVGSGGYHYDGYLSCDGAADLHVVRTASPAASGALDCGYYGPYALTAVLNGDSLRGEATGSDGCGAPFTLTHDAALDRLTGTLATCSAGYGDWAFPVVLRRVP